MTGSGVAVADTAAPREEDPGVSGSGRAAVSASPAPDHHRTATASAPAVIPPAAGAVPETARTKQAPLPTASPSGRVCAARVPAARAVHPTTVVNAPLPHRIPGHPGYHYYLASGGWWVHGPAGFVGLFATRRDLDRWLVILTGATS